MGENNISSAVIEPVSILNCIRVLTFQFPRLAGPKVFPSVIYTSLPFRILYQRRNRASNENETNYEQHYQLKTGLHNPPNL